MKEDTECPQLFDLNLRRVVLEKIKLTTLSTKEFSQYAGFHRDYLGHVLGFRRPMTLKNLNKIATALDTTPGNLTSEARRMENAG